MASELEKRLLFSGAFRPESVVATIAVALGLAVIVSKLFPGDGAPSTSSSSYNTPTTDPINPLRYPDLGSTRRREHCTMQYINNPSMATQGTAAFSYSMRTFRQCVYY